jgi:murein DD-endopeptidase MepM/ murein hydrolase activator NlpD
VKSLSRREFLAIAAGLGGAAAVSGAGWLIASSASDGEEGGAFGLSPGSGNDEQTASPTQAPAATATAEPTQAPTESPTEVPTEAPTAEPTNPPTPNGEPTGYAYPLSGVHVPDKDSQLPNAARDYRCGLHEGVDFYPYDSGPYFARGEPVLAARAGVVRRADHDYVEYTVDERNADLATTCQAGGGVAEILDRLRGRQVWIEHDDGNFSRYCHLNNVLASVSEGTAVAAGEVIAGVGNSGTSNGAAGTDMDIHLHFELRLGGADGPYLGAGQPVAEVRRLFGVLFTS